MPLVVVDASTGLIITGTDDTGTLILKVPTVATGTFVLGTNATALATYSVGTTTYSTNNNGTRVKIMVSSKRRCNNSPRGAASIMSS